MGDKTYIDGQIAQIAGGQRGNITRQQLLSLGVGRESINWRVKTGRLYPIYRGVYAVGCSPTTPLDKGAAAVLVCGDRSALSHGSAMTLWGFWKRWEAPFEVSVASDRRPKGIHVHRVAGLVRRDVRVVQGIRITSPARTLLDKAPTIPARSLTRFVNDGRRREILTVDDLADVAARFPRHPGAPLLRGQLTDQNPTRSGFENDFLSFCERFGLPIPRVNTMVHGYEADAYFEAEKLIVECDGWEFHNDRGAFEDDRERDAAMLALGIVTIRITKRRLKANPVREAERLYGILADRRRLLAA